MAGTSKKHFLNDCKDCKTFWKFKVILSIFIYGAYFEFYDCFLWMIIFQIDLRESIGNFRSQANLKPINLTRWRTLATARNLLVIRQPFAVSDSREVQFKLSVLSSLVNETIIGCPENVILASIRVKLL